MPRSTIISRQIAEYDRIVTDDLSISDVELAIFKIAICQLVDSVFSGGGGGGTSASTISSGIDSSIDINTILARLISIDNKTISQSDIVDAIGLSTDIDTIVTRLTSLDTNRLTTANIESAVQNAIQSASDLDTVIARLTSIVTNTSSPVSSSNIVTSYTHSSSIVNDVGISIAANVNRKNLIIINRSTSISCDLFLGAVGVFGTGLPLEPKQSYEINSNNLYRGAIGLTTSANNAVPLAIAEGV